MRFLQSWWITLFLVFCLVHQWTGPWFGVSDAGSNLSDLKVFDNKKGKKSRSVGDNLAEQIVYIFDSRSQQSFACTVRMIDDVPSISALAGPVPYETVQHLLLNPPAIPPD
jgi:hypothetical protein